MDSPAPRKNRKRTLIHRCLVALVPSLILALLAYHSGLPKRWKVRNRPSNALSYSSQYPVSIAIQKEVLILRARGTLKADNATLIHRATDHSAAVLSIPASLLWCLLFQESRLNHLLGLEGDRGTYGLGQFSHFSFYEINHGLDNFYEDKEDILRKLFGGDIRPLSARREALFEPTSYYFIPTAVGASAIYLNNRYHHLKGELERVSRPYDPSVLWLHAALAYNKGTRSMLMIWNEVVRRWGKAGLDRFLSEGKFFFYVVERTPVLSRSLGRIWPMPQAEAYAKEALMHVRGIGECSLSTSKIEKGQWG